MNIYDYIELLLAKDKERWTEFVQVTPRPSATKNQVKQLMSKLEAALKSGDSVEAESIAVTLLMFDADKTIEKLRRKGAFRASRYEYKSQPLKEVLHTLDIMSEYVVIGAVQREYLSSILALNGISEDVGKLYDSLLERLHDKKEVVVKTVLATVDTMYARGWSVDRRASASTLRHYSAEELCEGVTTLLQIFDKKIGLKLEYLNSVDDLVWNSEDELYENMLLDAVKVNEFLNAETSIDGLPYRATRLGQIVTISSINPNFEKSVRLGYIQTNQQSMIRMHALHDEMKRTSRFLSIEEFVQQAFEAGLGELIELKTRPEPRLVMKIYHEERFFDPFTTNSLFLEEVISQQTLSIHEFDGLPRNTKITEQLSESDILKVQRFFSFLSHAYQAKLKEISDPHAEWYLRYRSVIPVLHHQDLNKMISMIIGADAAEQLIRLWTLDDTRDYWDLQYTPFVKVGEKYAISPAILANSNMVRNTVCANSLHETLKSGPDPMQTAVEKALISAGFLVKPSIHANIDGKRETDIFAWRDGILFVFECKNAYHPCTTHEMRNSYWHIEKAQSQLDLRKLWLQNPENQRKLFAQFGWEVLPADEIFTGIIIANRVCHGYRQGEHPVRQAHELINVLLRGEIHSSMSDEVIRFWKGDSFHSSDLTEYLLGGTLIADQFSLMRKIRREIVFSKQSLVYETYAMEEADVSAYLRSRYEKSPNAGL